MPTDDDYGRNRQIPPHVSTASSSAASQPPNSPLPPCAAGCLAAPAADNQKSGNAVETQQQNPPERSYANDRLQSERSYANDRVVSQQTERTFASDRYSTVAERNGSDRYGTDRIFSSERAGSDRLPSGERYQGISERYPLGEQPRTSVSTERLLSKDVLQGQQQQTTHCQSYQPQERYHYSERAGCQKYPERYTPVQNVGSLDRYHHSTLDRYSRTSTPTDRYHTLSTENKERCSSTDRHTPIEKYQTSTMENFSSNDRLSSTQSVCSIERYTPTERHRSVSKSDIYKIRERSSSSEKKDRHQREHHQTRYEHDQYIAERFNQDRFNSIPCPERFSGTQPERPERMQFSQVPYLEPPSPAPASDRFIPPPPLSPDSTPSPDCFTNNSFPSPTVPTPASNQDRFIPPPPLSLSPTETYTHSPAKKAEKYDKSQRYQEKYHYSPNMSSDRYHEQPRYKERYQNYPDRYQTASPNANYHQHQQPEKFVNNDRFSGERYVPPNAHMPVERYVPQPQPQETYYAGSYQSYDRFNKQFNSNDPYMRRDLTFHYRLPMPYTQNQYQRIRYSQAGTPNRVKCCQYQENYQLSKSSPGSSSNSSVTSQGAKEPHCTASSLQDVQCQSYQTKDYQSYQSKEEQYQGTTQQYHSNQYQQEKSTQCCPTYARVVAPSKGSQCRHSICGSPSVEYVGASGGRHVCATPPPRGSIGSENSVCTDNCCARRGQGLAGTIVTIGWRTSPSQPQSTAQTQDQPQSQQHSPPKSNEQSEPSPVPPTTSTQRAVTPLNPPQPSSTSSDQGSTLVESASPIDIVSPQKPQPVVMQPTPPPIRTTAVVQRAVSLPVAPPERQQRVPQAQRVNYSQSERIPNRERPPLNRSLSKKEIIKNYIKKETANFFGVDEDNEEEQQIRWFDRRKRMASRTMGPLKEEYRTLSRPSHRRAVSEIPPANQISGHLVAERPDVLPGDNTDGAQERLGDVTVRRKDSVARMTWDGLSYVVTTLTRHRPRPRSQQSQWSRSFPPDTPSVAATPPEEQSFFEKPALPPSPRTVEAGDTIDSSRVEGGLQPAYRERERYSVRLPPGGWRREHDDVVLRHGENRPNIGGSRILSNTLDHVLDNSDRRMYGMGWVGRLFGQKYRRSVVQDLKIQQQLDDMDDHRPTFTYWVTTVQVLVLFISIICYGFGPFGVDLQSRSGQVLVTSLSLQQVDYFEPANFWFGPRAADLIHLGAKFAPCMRVDDKISKQINHIRAKEKETACCIRNDDSGCVQSSQADCSKTISTWKKWTAGDAGPGGRMSGSVCGLDPKFCDAPASVHPYEWPDDITKWPICRKTNQFSMQKKEKGPRDKLAEHMVCEVIGHPCCIGIHGMCKITTKEYCDFVRGTFHEEASLCSQVSCLNDVCGMISFYFPDTPDQFYRLWTSLFLHAGVLQLVITILIQYFLMRDLEKLTGSFRIGIIYIGSGMGGNLASAIFVPYRADVGPSGSQFGLLACLIVEVLNSWPMLKHPNQAICKLLSITLFLFLIGLLPWVDNYAHLFGFIFGFLLSYAMLPFISFGHYDRQKKIFLIWVCLIAAGTLFVCLMLLFYIIPVYDCQICSYFNCLPLTRDFCASQNINFKREDNIV